MKDKVFNFIKASVLSALIFASGNTNSYAATLGIAETPLFLGTTVQPNVFFLLDDSGSMDWEILTTNYWAYYAYDPDWDHNGTSGSSSDDNAFITDGQFYAYGPSGYSRWRKLYSQGNATGDTCSPGDTMEACGLTNHPSTFDWRFRTHNINVTFYNPSVTYQPWNGPCGASGELCTDGDYRAALNNPKSCGTCKAQPRDLAVEGDATGVSTTTSDPATGAFKYDVWIDDSGYADYKPFRGDNTNETGVAAGAAAAPNGEVDLWDTHISISVGVAAASISRVSYDPKTSAEGGRALNETSVTLGTITGTTTCYDILGPKPNVEAIHNQGATPVITAVNGPGCRTIADVQTNIANWYQYSRRRMYAAKNAITQVMDAQPNFRYGITKFKGQGSLFIEVPPAGSTASDIAAHNLNIKDDMYRDKQEGIGTFLTKGLEDVGEYFKHNRANTDNPIKHSCQKNFQIAFTDGYWNDSNNAGDIDGDGVSDTGADIAYKYFKDDLNTTIANNVSPDAGSEAELDPDGDGKTWQHLVTFTVAFGVNGVMSDGDGDGWPDADATGTPWPGDGKPLKNGDWGDASYTSSAVPSKIDDLWHAAWNTNGTYAAASTPEEVVEKLIAAIINIAGRVGSASAVALNSGTLNANSRLYQASFDSNDWSGSLKSVPIQDGPVDILPLGAPDGSDDSPSQCDSHPVVGELCEVEWNAGEKLAAKSHSTREIFTFSSDTNAGVAFKTLTDLGAAQQTSLRTNPTTALLEAASRGQERLDYIRGDHSKEGISATEFRARKLITGGKTKLGDIIHSAPAYIANPVSFIPNNFESASYNAYKVAQKNRKPVVYVGANDGMLHAFDASNNTSTKGEEMFAYIPGKLVDKLPLLTSQTYKGGHTYYVDGSPISFDAFNGNWKTLIAGSTGAGGQIVYGLDVTNPETFGASNVLWEFTDVPRVGSSGEIFGDVDLGYTIGDVSFARMYNGDWAVIFGNGFNNTAPDGNVSTTGNAAIYVVNAFTGELIKKFDTQVGMAEDPAGAGRPNGISSVTPIDIDGDLKADYLYAGDLFGNVWKMDVTSANPSVWDSSYSATGKPKPFHIAKNAAGVIQPITTAVAVKRHPEKVNQTLVFFGTGSYFQVNDSADTQVQSFYSIWDDNTSTQYDRLKLLKQEILGIEFVTGVDGVTREFRLTSSGNIDPANYQIDWTKHKGWYIDLTESGERVNVEPVLRGSRIIFVSLTPDADPCSSGGTSWIMELDANGGSRLEQSPFDVNGDGLIDELDIVDFSGDAKTIVSGVRSKDGIVAKPGILNTKQDKELKFFSGTSGGIDTITESVDEGSTKRQSWRQLR